MMKTIKLPYSLVDKNDSIVIKGLILNQNTLVKCLYNFLQKNPNVKQKEITSYANSLKNIEIDSWFKQSAYYDAKIFNERENVIFGGKKLFKKRSKQRISKAEFQERKMFPLVSIGESLQKGNRKFSINLENNEIIFKPSKGVKIFLQLPNLRKNFKDQLEILETLSNNKSIPITYKLDVKHIHISFDDRKIIKTKVRSTFKSNRICSLDLNPNFIGYSIIEWDTDNSYKILKSELIAFKDLAADKKKHEIILACERIVRQASHFQCQFLALEDLQIKSKNHNKGKVFNKAVNNNWFKTLIERQIFKKCILNNIEVLRIAPHYSSIVGNIFFEDLKMPDPILSSIERNRRAFHYLQNTLKDNFYPNLNSEKLKAIKKSLEERNNSVKNFNSCEMKDWLDIFKVIKNSKLRYRISELESTSSLLSVFKLKYYKNEVTVSSYSNILILF